MEIIVVLWRPTGVGAARPVQADKGVLGSGTAVNKGGGGGGGCFIARTGRRAVVEAKSER